MPQCNLERPALCPQWCSLTPGHRSTVGTAAPSPAVGPLCSGQPEHPYTALTGLPQGDRGGVNHAVGFGLRGAPCRTRCTLLPVQDVLLSVWGLRGLFFKFRPYQIPPLQGVHSSGVTQSFSKRLERVLPLLGSGDRDDQFLPQSSPRQVQEVQEETDDKK